MINKKGLFLLEEIIKKDFSAKYKDSALGILWSVLKPLFIMVLLTIIFSTVFGGQIENYPVYFLSGKCIYDFFSGGTSISVTTLKRNKNILKSTPAPKYIFVLGSVFSEFINFIITLIILLFVMIATHAPFHATIPLAIIPIISLLISIIGLGLILSVICVYYTDIAHLWHVVISMGMYACALFYPMDIIPEPYHSYMILNPLYWIIDQFRLLAAYGTLPNLLYVVNSLIFSTIILIIGVILYKTCEKRIIMKV